jgi:hypothetical protein
MRKLLFAAATAMSLVAAIPALAKDNTEMDGLNTGGFDIGPLGQCFDARGCGRGAYAYAHACPMVRERIVTESGRVIFRRHRVCD